MQKVSVKKSVVSIFRGWVFVNSAVVLPSAPLSEEMCLVKYYPAYQRYGHSSDGSRNRQNAEENYGFTKEDFSQWLSENAKMPAERFWGRSCGLDG